MRDKTKCLRWRLGRHGLTDFELIAIMEHNSINSGNSSGARAVLHIPEDRKTLMMDFDRFKCPLFLPGNRAF